VTNDPLHLAIEQLLQAYFKAEHARGDIYDRILALVPAYGADTVVNALPRPWRRTFYEWVQTTFGNELPHEQFAAVGNAAPASAIAAIRTWLAAHPQPPDHPKMTPEADDLVIVPAEDIAYSTLATQTLFDLAIQEMEPSIAGHALAELAQRDVHQERDAAEAILLEPVWDHHLTGYAMTILYHRDPRRALELMAPFLASEDPVILDEMIDIVLENPADFATGKKRAFATNLATRVAAMAPGMFTKVERRAEFLAQYGAKES
jgi:hypothetical protein